MRVIVVGSERNLFKEGSAARERILGYGALFEELHIIVFTGRGSEFKQQKIADNVFVYPTRSWSRFFYVSGAKKIARRLRNSFLKHPLPDTRIVVSAQDPFESGLVAKQIAPLFGARLHLQIHTDFLSPYFSSSILNRTRVAIAKKILPLADSVRVVSKSIEQGLIESGLVSREKIKVLPIYVDVSTFDEHVVIEPTSDLRKKFPEFKFIALMASRLAPEKDMGLAIRAVATLAKENPYVGLVIAGEGSEKHRLMKLAHKCDAGRNVRFIPWQRHLGSLYKTANVFVLTSSFEGYGMALVEAALSGAPIISTKVGIAMELKDGKEALLCDVGDEECILKKMRLLVHDQSLRQLVKANARLAMLSHLPDKETYLQMYKESFELAFAGEGGDNVARASLTNTE